MTDNWPEIARTEAGAGVFGHRHIGPDSQIIITSQHHRHGPEGHHAHDEGHGWERFLPDPLVHGESLYDTGGPLRGITVEPTMPGDATVQAWTWDSVRGDRTTVELAPDAVLKLVRTLTARLPHLLSAGINKELDGHPDDPDVFVPLLPPTARYSAIRWTSGHTHSWTVWDYRTGGRHLAQLMREDDARALASELNGRGSGG